jgi:Ca2+-binding RTX toxin-like protein
VLTTVANSNGLVAALNTAHSGDTIQLAAGTYSTLLLQNYNFAGAGVTITSADPAHQAILTGMTLRNDTGFNISNVEMTVNPAGADNPFQIASSTNINLNHLNVHGSLDGNPQDDVGGMIIRDSSNVTLSNSEFQQLHWAVTQLNDTGLTITNNNFHDIRTDGIRGGGSSNVTISHNAFSSFSPVAGDHADAIQFWTTNTTASAHDITISDNVITRGSGDAFQGIFMRDDVGNLPFQNVQISGNLVSGGLYNGIVVQGGTHVAITGNEVIGLADQPSWIDVRGDSNVTLANNQATQFLNDGSTNVTATNDTTIATPTDGGKALISAFLHQNPTDIASTTLSAQLTSSADATVAKINAVMADSVTITGTAGDDKLTINATHDTVINAGAGNDLLYGGGVGHNTLVGGLGDDTYYVKSDLDTVVEQAGGGNDTVSSTVDFTLPDNVETLKFTGTTGNYGTGNALDNKIVGGVGDDHLYGLAGNDNIVGNGGNDYLSGGDGSDTLSSAVGSAALSLDTLSGDAGNDSLTGGVGNDSLVGGDGNDTLTGGGGNDTMTGGSGADMFYFRAGDLGPASGPSDVITDFSTADGDKINLNAIDAKSATTVNDVFTFIGNQAFHHVAGELRFQVQGHDVVVSGDTNGDGVADFNILVQNVTTLHTTDFVL